MLLTDTACKNAKCPEGKPRERYSDSGGLYLEVTASGSKLWRWKYRYNGKEKRLAIGIYPKVSLLEACKARERGKELLAAGSDPVQAKRDAKLASRVALSNTFEAVGRAWHEDWKGLKSPRHAEYVIRRLEADVFPAIGAKARRGCCPAARAASSLRRAGSTNDRSALVIGQPADAAEVVVAERTLLPAANWYYRPSADFGAA